MSSKSTICVISGSGISKASGIPTFRGEDGLWNNYRVEELATPEAFTSNPTLVWEWYHWRIRIIAKAKPNPAHKTLANLEKKNWNVYIITQNVDDLHERAGSREVLHLHGKINNAKCSGCSNRFTWDSEKLKHQKIVPVCGSCGSNYRPDVVWFGESLDTQKLDTCREKLLIADVLLVIGTSSIVYPAASLPMITKQMNPGIKIYEFNMERTPISHVADQTILGPVEETLTKFVTDKGFL